MSLELALIQQVKNRTNKPPTSIVNCTSAGGSAGLISPWYTSFYNGKRIISGSLSATVLATALSLSGAGIVDALVVLPNDTTSRTIRVKVTIDGAVVYDAISSAITALDHGHVVLGLSTNNGATLCPQPRCFNSSFLVEIASSLTESSTITVGALYTLN